MVVDVVSAVVLVVVVGCDVVVGCGDVLVIVFA